MRQFLPSGLTITTAFYAYCNKTRDSDQREMRAGIECDKERLRLCQLKKEVK